MKPLPWSHSALSDFNNCPKAYHHKRVLKDVVDPPNEAGMWGDYVHKEFEKYLKAWDAYTSNPYVLPADLEQYRVYLDALAMFPGKMHVECRYAITKHLAPCDFFAKDVWCRCIIDVLHIDGERAHVLDHKTGKRKMDARQLKLCALMVFLPHPEVKVIKVGYAWLKEHTSDYEHYVRTGMDELWNEFVPDLTSYSYAARNMLFGPRPSGLCNGWCPVQTCEFWKPKRSR